MKTRSPSEPVLRFDPEEHKYWIGKKRLPSVSEILQKVGLSKDYSQIDPFYRDRGIATHKAIELHLKGILDPTSLDQAVKPCFEAFLAYSKACPLGKILALEKPMTNGVFAGTPDLVTEQALYDWKCSKSHDRVAELQGEAYKTLYPARHLNFVVVELHDDGTHAEFNYGYETGTWEAVMQLYYWRTK